MKKSRNFIILGLLLCLLGCTTSINTDDIEDEDFNSFLSLKSSVLDTLNSYTSNVKVTHLFIMNGTKIINNISEFYILAHRPTN